MNNEKKTFEAPEMTIVLLDCDLLITSAGTLGADSWASFDFNQL